MSLRNDFTWHIKGQYQTDPRLSARVSIASSYHFSSSLISLSQTWRHPGPRKSDMQA